jgi:phage baseplate assembly protein W|tara:strand:+ start:88 stop:504 length:417 start_codon:yes stop_codon:yes gene_type:complete
MAAIYTKGLSTNNRQWADLDLDFVKHPITKDIVKKTNVEAVKRSVRNLILTNRYDKFFHPEVDGGVTRHLFGLSTAHTMHDIEIAVKTCLSNYEPRVVVNSVLVGGDLDNNGFNVSIFFTVINTPEPIQISLFLKRTR